MNRPVRVFQLSKSLGRGGAEVLLSEGYDCANHDRFTYGYGYFLPWKDAVANDLEAKGAEVVCFDASTNPGILLASRKVAQHIERWRADIVHCHLPLAGIAGRIAGKLSGVPVVYTEHNEWEFYHSVTRRANHLTWRMQQHVIAVSQGVADSIHRNAGTVTPVSVEPNGVNVQTYSPDQADGTAVRVELGIADDAPVIGTVAVFRGQKQLHHWLQIAKRVWEERPQTRFIVVGMGTLYEDLDAYRHSLGLADVVHFAGFQSNVKPYLAAIDAYMMTSVIEGLPVALLESMAMGLPSITTAVGGIPEVIDEGRNGFLVPLNVDETDTAQYMQRSGKNFDSQLSDTEEFVRAAVTLIDDPLRRRAMGAAARETIIERHSIQRMMRDIEELYESVLQNR